MEKEKKENVTITGEKNIYIPSEMEVALCCTGLRLAVLGCSGLFWPVPGCSMQKNRYLWSKNSMFSPFWIILLQRNSAKGGRGPPQLC